MSPPRQRPAPGLALRTPRAPAPADRRHGVRRRALRLGALAGLTVATVVATTVATAGPAQAFLGPPVPPVPPRLPLAGAVVLVDPGHNGRNWAHPEVINRTIYAGNGVYKACNTTGTSTAGGYTEAAYTFDVARRTATQLRLLGATVYLTRPDNRGVGPCSVDRAAQAAERHADVMVSIHADGSTTPGARGFHVIASTDQIGPAAVTSRSHTFAHVVRSHFRSGTGMPYATYVAGGDGLVYRHDLGTLNLSAVPAVLVETGNMRNATDARLLTSSAFRQREAAALADGIAAYLGD